MVDSELKILGIFITAFVEIYYLKFFISSTIKRSPWKLKKIFIK